MGKIIRFLGLVAVLVLTGCDLQPKITSIPDNVGEFITNRYPALLADPETEPEIYNSAVTDYGVYASPELYGSGGVDDYIMYASVDDYTLQPSVEVGQPIIQQKTPSPESAVVYGGADDYLQVPVYGGIAKKTKEIVVSAGDTLYSLSRKYGMMVDELAKLNNLKAPYSLSIGQKLKVSEITEVVTAQTRAEIKSEPVKTNVIDITVAKGDTLYSVSRKYAVPVNELAVMNKLTPPFALAVGQKLKVPVVITDKVASAAPVKSATTPVKTQPKTTTVVPAKPKTVTPTPTKPKTTTTTASQPKTKISSDPTAKMPAIAARSSSKFSWPLRGTVLSNYGAKSNGLHNDGINISAKAGTKVGAAENGVVAYAGNEVKGMGNLVIVQHSDGWMTVYAHMDKMSVRRGVKVTVGQQIGTVGQTGKVDKPQLHFEIRKGTKAYDPSQYLKK